MALFPPNVKRLRDQHDVKGLIRALHYAGTSKKAQQVRLDACDYLAGYPYARVVEALMEVGLGGSPESRRALHSVRRLLYPYFQKNDELIAWWASNKDTLDELRAKLNSARALSHSNQWDAVRRTIEGRIKPPMHIEILARRAIYGDDVSEEERAEVYRWNRDLDEKIAPELEAARAELEAKWAAEETEDAALEKWTP